MIQREADMEMDALADALGHFEDVFRVRLARLKSAVLAEKFGQDMQTEIQDLQTFIRELRSKLYQVVARVRAAEGKGPLADDLTALIDSIDEKGARDGSVSDVRRSREAHPVRGGGGAGVTALRGVRGGNDGSRVSR